jgi:hypothetical protein
MKINVLYVFLLAGLFGCAPGKPSFVKVQTKELYDINTVERIPSVNGFTALDIFTETMDNTVWASPEKNCLALSKDNEHAFMGKNSLHVKWDKVTGGCKWIGIGFGWNAWQPKDMIDIVNDAAVEMKVKAAKGGFSNLPVAFAFEDYTGTQSYCGFSTKLASGRFNDSTWTTVTIPLKNFPFQLNDADLGKMKQFIIQLEGDGDIYLDEIKIISYSDEK